MNIFLVSIIISIAVTAVLGIILKVALRKKLAFHSANNDTKSIKNIKAIKIVSLAMVLIFSFLISLQVISLTNIQKNFVYDLYGNAYSVLTDVPLYDEYGNEYYYQINDDNKSSSYIGKNNEIHSSRDTYLTKGGYIVFLEEDKIESYNGLYDTMYEDGEHYYAVIHPCWNKDGDLILNPDAVMYNEESIIISKEEQLDYQKEKGIKLFSE